MSELPDANEKRGAAPPRKTRPMRRMRNRVVAKVKNVEDRARQSSRKRVRASLYVWRLCVQVVLQWQRDRCPQQAAGLSFQTVLSVVPALAVALAAFKAFDALGAESTLIDYLAHEFLPLSREEIAGKLLSLSENISFETVGLVGLVTTLLIAFVTYNGLEKSVNHIWRVEKRRALPKRALAFLFAVSIGPLLFGLSLYQAAQFGLADGWSGVLLSPLTTFGGLFIANFLMPATPVRPTAALVGAAVNTVAAELAKFAFTAYVGAFAMDRYAGIYGTLAAVPLCLIWIYWSWLMLLLGVEVSHTVQNFRLLESADRRVALSLASEVETRVNGTMGVRVMAAIAAAQAEGKSGLSRFRLSKEFGLSDDVVRLITNRLHEHHLLRAPTRDDNWSVPGDAADTSVLQIFDCFRGQSELRDPEELGESPAEHALADLLSESRAQANEITIADIAADMMAASIAD